MAITPQTFSYFRELVLARSAIVLEPGKEYLLEARLATIVRKQNEASLDTLATTLSKTSYGPIHREVVEAMTTNETSFFRDIHPFDTLRNVVMPELIERKKHTKQLNFWCAAASTGQEPYSVAILLREHFPVLKDWKINFLATDLSSAVLAKAQSGLFSQLEVNRGLPAPLLVKYFTKVGMNWQVRDDIRTLVQFKELNLIERWPVMPIVDIVFMRNVLIYFDVKTKKTILKNTRAIMSPDGYLLLGSAETTMAIDEEFHRVQTEKGVTYRITKREPTTGVLAHAR